MSGEQHLWINMGCLSLKVLSKILRLTKQQHKPLRVLKKEFSSLSTFSYNRHQHSIAFLSCFLKSSKHLTEPTQLHGTEIYKIFHSCFSTVPRAPESESQLAKDSHNDCSMQHPFVERPNNERIFENHIAKNNSEIPYLGHIPVLVKETLTALSPKENQVIVDMTFGAGGHACHILKSTPCLTYIASDRDPEAQKRAVEFSSNYKEGQVVPVLSKFSELAAQLLRLRISPGSVDAFFMDLGASSMQFDTAERGFSLSRDGPLDMRMDGERFPDSSTAADVVNSLDASDLGQILKKYGDESHAMQIAHAIVEARYAFGKFTRTSQLADVIKRVFDSSFRHDKLHRHAHVATKTFQALRIFVNDELNEIHNGLEVARHFLKPGGRCVAISFHSLEDRIVKRHFHDINMDEKPNISARYHLRNTNISYEVDNIKETYMHGPWKPLSRKVIEATDEEISHNPRARSAKLRVAIKTDNV